MKGKGPGWADGRTSDTRRGPAIVRACGPASAQHARCMSFGAPPRQVPINVKGKTNETLGYLGRQEAIEAQAVVLVERAL